MNDIAAAVAAIDRLLEKHRRTIDAAGGRQRLEQALLAAAESTRECERRHYEYFEDVYHTEEKRRDTFTTQFSFFLGVLGVAGAVATFYLRDAVDWASATSFSAIFGDWTLKLYLLFLLFDLIGLGVASFFLIRAMFSYTYQYLASPVDIRNHYQSLLAFYADPIAAERAFQQYLTDQYAEAATTNDRNNVTRRKYLYRCLTAAICLFVFLALTFIPFLSHKLTHRAKSPLLIRWDDAHVTIHDTPNAVVPITFDKNWPQVEFFFPPFTSHAEQTKTNAASVDN